MGKLKINFLEGEDFIDKGAGKKKRRGFDRMPTDKKYARIRDMDIEGENEPKVINFKPKKLVDATSVHAGPNISKPADKNSAFRIEPVKTGSKKPYSPKNDLEHWNDDDNKMLNAVAEVLDKASDEKVIELKKEIVGFSPAEQRFIDPMAEDYSNEFWEEKRKVEKKGIKTTDRWVSAFRDSYINKRLGWGSERQLAPEKKTILEKYLNLKLPAGIPEKKVEIIQENSEKTNNESLKDLTITNKNMEISVKDAGKQTKKDSFPVGAGYMGEPVNLDAREAEEVKARRTGTENKKEKEPKFSLEEMKAIKDMAYHISERRMAGDNDGAKAWQEELAKEYGFDENAFSKETIEDIELPNGKRIGDIKWTPEAEEFMRNWDWGKAEEAFRNMKAKKQENDQSGDEQARIKRIKAAIDLHIKNGGLDDKEKDNPKSKAEESFHPPVIISGSERERSVVPVKSEIYVAEPIPGKPQQKVLENAFEKTLEELKADLDAKADVYATARGNAKGSRGYLAKLLGMSKKGFSENVEEMEEVKAARSEYLQAKLEHSKAAAESAFKEYQDKLQGGTTSPEELEALRIKWEAISNYHNRASDIELQGKFVEKTIEYYNTKGGVLGKVFGKYLDLYNNVYLKKVPPKVRAAISIAMLGGAVAGLAGAFGVTGIFVGAASVVSKPARFLLAPLFPAMTYTGTGKMIEKGLQWKYAKKGKKRSAAFGEVIGKMKSGEASVEETRKNILKLLEEQNKECEDDLVNRGWWEDRWEQVRNILTTVVGARATMVLMSGTEAIGSFFEGKGNMAGVAGSSPKGALYTQGSGGKTIITPEGMKAIDNSSAGSAKLSPGDYEKIGKHPYFSEPEVQTPEIAKPQFEEIDSVKTNTGGSMWKGIENSIRANPAAYHLDSSDSNFRKSMNGKIAEMLHDFADKKGLSYEQLDKVFTDDTFKLMHDNATGKFYLDDYQGKAFGGNVSHGGAGAAQEIASNKPNMPVEDVKQKAGIAPEDAVKTRTGLAPKHQPVRGAGKTMQYEPDTPDQKIAKEDFAKADQYQKDLRAYNAQEAARLEVVNEAANEQLRLSTSAEVKELFYGSGVSLRTNILDKPMSAWENLIGKENYIAQDVQLTDKTRVASFNKLKNLRLILERYNTSGSETIGECLSKAVKDTKVMYMIRKLVF